VLQKYLQPIRGKEKTCIELNGVRIYNKTNRSDKVEYYYVHLHGSAVFDSIMLSGALKLLPNNEGGMTLHGSDENFSFAPFGVEVLVDVETVRFDNGTSSHRKAWVSFPYSAVQSVVHHSLSQEEMIANGLTRELKSEPIGFKTSAQE